MNGAGRNLLVLLLGFLVGLGVTVAGAAIPDAEGLIHACYDSRSGQARIVDSEDGLPRGCLRTEQAVSWAQQGPPGPSGVSQGFSARTAFPGAFIPYTTPETLLDFDLAAGNYLFNGSLDINQGTPVITAGVRCRLVSPEGTLWEDDWFDSEGPSSFQESMAAAGAATFASPQTVRLECEGFEFPGTRFLGAYVDAVMNVVKIDTMTTEVFGT
jgi:hypothetical protein